jgi:hypothetical protein
VLGYVNNVLMACKHKSDLEIPTSLEELKEVLNAISKSLALKSSKFEHPRLLGNLNSKSGYSC